MINCVVERYSIRMSSPLCLSLRNKRTHLNEYNTQFVDKMSTYPLKLLQNKLSSKQNTGYKQS